MKRALSILTGSALLLLAASAAADEPGDGYVTNDEADGYGVKFVDDLLDGKNLGATGPLIRVRQPPTRTLLIRPRTSFVSELRKSVENL